MPAWPCPLPAHAACPAHPIHASPRLTLSSAPALRPQLEHTTLPKAEHGNKQLGRAAAMAHLAQLAALFMMGWALLSLPATAPWQARVHNATFGVIYALQVGGGTAPVSVPPCRCCPLPLLSVADMALMGDAHLCLWHARPAAAAGMRRWPGGAGSKASGMSCIGRPWAPTSLLILPPMPPCLGPRASSQLTSNVKEGALHPAMSDCFDLSSPSSACFRPPASSWRTCPRSPSA